MARFNVSPKTHNPGIPLPLIVTLRDSPTFEAATWIASKLQLLTLGSTKSAKSAAKVLQKI